MCSNDLSSRIKTADIEVLHQAEMNLYSNLSDSYFLLNLMMHTQADSNEVVQAYNAPGHTVLNETVEVTDRVLLK